jgi:hypothetical protein
MYSVSVIRKVSPFQTEMLFNREGQALPELIEVAVKWRDKHAPDATVKYHLQPGI